MGLLHCVSDECQVTPLLVWDHTLKTTALAVALRLHLAYTALGTSVCSSEQFP